MSNETVTYSLEAVLTRIEGKIDNLQRDVTQKFDKIDERLTKLEIGQAGASQFCNKYKCLETKNVS